MKVNKGVLIVMRARRTTSNFYKLSKNTIVSDVTLVVSDNDATNSDIYVSAISTNMR